MTSGRRAKAERKAGLRFGSDVPRGGRGHFLKGHGWARTGAPLDPDVKAVNLAKAKRKRRAARNLWYGVGLLVVLFGLAGCDVPRIGTAIHAGGGTVVTTTTIPTVWACYTPDLYLYYTDRPCPPGRVPYPNNNP